MSEKVIHEVRFIETDDGFRIEVKGDKERIRKMGFGPGMGTGMMGFGSGKHTGHCCHGRHGRHMRHMRHFGPWADQWDEDDADDEVKKSSQEA